MNIVLKWNFKTLISDLPRLLLTICGIAVTYAIIVGMGLSLASSVAATGSMNEGLANYAVRIVTPIIQASFAATIFVLFAVMLAERKNQIFIMRTVGCTTRQLLWGLLAESLAMDTAGMLPGVGLGVFMAWSLSQTAGYPIALEALFGHTVFLRGLLPTFFLVPAAMLLASVQLFRKKSGKRKKSLSFQ